MYTGLLHTHSTLRYFVMILLLVVIVKSGIGWMSRRPYENIDNKLSLWLLIATHTQLLIGLFLYFVSPFVQFSPSTMKDSSTRYWTMEHVVIMILAIGLITVARISHKKLSDGTAKHMRLFVLNSIAFICIIVGILLSGRGVVSMP